MLPSNIIANSSKVGRFFHEPTRPQVIQIANRFSSNENRENNGGIWNAGDTLQTAIGQSDNLFTPLQLANYCSTVANGGTRYELHFVKSIISSASGNVNEKTKSVAESVGLSQSTINTVHQGMRLVATNGGPYLVFSNMKTKVACKTGTSEVKVNGVKRNNGFLITFAPYNHPEIAVSSVVELAGSGSETAEMTKDIINYWYQNNTDAKENQKVGTLLP